MRFLSKNRRIIHYILILEYKINRKNIHMKIELITQAQLEKILEEMREKSQKKRSDG